jgi:hypothetical protein
MQVGYDSADRTQVSLNRAQPWAVVDEIMNLRIAQKGGNYLTS